jgi:hypothetical protein
MSCGRASVKRAQVRPPPLIAREVRRLSGPGVPGRAGGAATPAPLQTIARGFRGSTIRSGAEWISIRVVRNGPRFPSAARPTAVFAESVPADGREEVMGYCQRLADVHGERRNSRSSGAGVFIGTALSGHGTVPHFEKMLYDQAQFLEVYAEGCRWRRIRCISRWWTSWSAF